MATKLKFITLFATLLSIVAAEDRLVRTTDPLSPAEERLALHVPEGFSIQLFAAEPMINKPINIAFDDEGRLWVSSTTEYPYAAEKSRWLDNTGAQVKDSRDAIKILTDADGDGSADTVVDFADGLNIPTGVLPWHRPEHHAGCIAWSIPYIRYFADTTGDGKCDLREVLYGPFGYEKDTHGMCSSFRKGPDGWIYATHGFNNISKVKGSDGEKISLTSGNTFRFRPDRSRIEVFTTGQVNPFGLAFDRRGNLYSADCHTAPVYQLIHGAEYPHFSKPEPPIGFGPKMIEHSHGSTGICGIIYLDRDLWGKKWNDHLLIGNPVNSTVNHDQIQFAGSTPTAVEQPDFITSDDPWFRPVDLTIGPDGALYIADFYNRIIGHYEVPLDHPGRDRKRGRIWRVVKNTDVTTEIPPVKPAKPDLTGDPFARRAAAAELYKTPQPATIKKLLQTLKSTPTEDTHLRHTLRLAIQSNLIAFPQSFRSIDPGDPQITSIALAVPSEASAEYLIASTSPEETERISHIARYGSVEVRQKLIDDLLQTKPGVSTLQSIISGLEEAEANSRSPELITHAVELANRLLDQRGSPDWLATAGKISELPWILQKRICTDGREVEVLSSLRKGERGAEQRTGKARTKSFAAPEKLSFWICGHRGHPDQPEHDKNLVRLVDTTSGTALRRAFPPRSDICRKVTWDLTDLKGKLVHLEVVDADAGRSYAWLGITRIEPDVVSVATFLQSSDFNEALTNLASYLKVSAPADLRDRLRPWLPAAPPAPPRAISAEEKARLDRLIAERVKSFDPVKTDRVKGEALFQIHCAVCHQRNGKGGLTGPQLDGIGKRGITRLAEDILDPNRNVDANFHLSILTKKDRTTAAGYVVAERGGIILLTDAAGKTHRIPKAEIEKRETSALSLMPPVFGQTLSEAEFRDLVGWLMRE